MNGPKILSTIRTRAGEAITAYIKGTRRSLKYKLFSYMLLLACLLSLVLITGLFLMGQFNSAGKSTFDALDMQMEVFENDITNHFDSIAAAGVELSKNMSSFLDEYLEKNDISFGDLKDNGVHIKAVQSEILTPLLHLLKQEDCSGVFVMLDTTVNTSLDVSDSSRSGLYLKISGYKSSYNPVSMLRGYSELADISGISLHRQWRLEFDTDLIPRYGDIASDFNVPTAKSYRLTDVFTIDGTEEDIMLMAVPMVSSDGTYYGICGFEINASYFMSYYAQPAKIDYLTYLLTPSDDNTINTEDGLSCGISDGYYRAPQGELTITAAQNGLSMFEGDDIPYIGITRRLSLTPNNSDYVLSVLVRKSEFDDVTRTENIKKVSLTIMLLFVAVSCCYFFSRRFLKPILVSLEKLKSDELNELPVDIPEITDLFKFLADKDREHEASMSTLEQERRVAVNEKDSILKEYEKVQSELGKAMQEYERKQTEFEKAQTELARLAYSRQAEIDPDAYSNFLKGIETLTATERRIFDYYLDGLGIKEIAEASGVKESTIYSHNKNIYSKLGINSLKQLLRYAALMRQQEQRSPESV